MMKGYIRAMTQDDAEMVLSWRNQDDVRVNMYHHEKIDLEPHLRWTQNILKRDDCKYFIYEQEQKPLGVLAIVDIDKKNEKASWAFYSGDTTVRGIGSEMEQLALNYVFNELKLNKLCCEVLEFNTSVISFHQKFGFKLEGIKRQDYVRDGKYYDIYQLALMKKDYLKYQQNLDFKLDKKYEWNFEISAEKIDQFAELSGDKNTVHLDVQVAQNMGFKDRISHGILLAAEISKVAAMDYPAHGAIYLQQNLQFKNPVYPDQPVVAKAKLKTQIGRFVLIGYEMYQTDKLVATGESEFLLKS